jgi:hypothetical protein
MGPGVSWTSWRQISLPVLFELFEVGGGVEIGPDWPELRGEGGGEGGAIEQAVNGVFAGGEAIADEGQGFATECKGEGLECFFRLFIDATKHEAVKGWVGNQLLDQVMELEGFERGHIDGGDDEQGSVEVFEGGEDAAEGAEVGTEVGTGVDEFAVEIG